MNQAITPETIIATARALPCQMLQLGHPAPDTDVTKAGVLPFIKTPQGIEICLAQPLGKKPELGPPPYQLSKGTRMVRKSGSWLDLRSEITIEYADQVEPLMATALREGMEEIGLILSNITRLYDCGIFTMLSASTGKEKPLALFAAEVKNTTDFLPMKDIADTTAARAWFTLAKAQFVTRPDQFAFIERVVKALP